MKAWCAARPAQPLCRVLSLAQCVTLTQHVHMSQYRLHVGTESEGPRQSKAIRTIYILVLTLHACQSAPCPRCEPFH